MYAYIGMNTFENWILKINFFTKTFYFVLLMVNKDLFFKYLLLYFWTASVIWIIEYKNINLKIKKNNLTQIYIGYGTYKELGVNTVLENSTNTKCITMWIEHTHVPNRC